MAKGHEIRSDKPLERFVVILSQDDRFEPAPDLWGHWTLAETVCTGIGRNDLTDSVQLKCEPQISETATGLRPATASESNRKVMFPMALYDDTTISQTKSAKKTPKRTPFNLSTALGPGDPDDGDPGRQQRGIAIAATSPIKKTKVGYSVRSQSGKGHYYAVRLDGEDGPACECDDFNLRNRPCKHIIAVQCYVMRDDEGSAEIEPIYVDSPEQSAEQPVVEKPAKKGRGRSKAEPVVIELPTLKPIEKKPVGNSKDGRNWPAYNEAQDIEGDVFPILLRELCDTIEQPEQHGPGRRCLPLSDMVFAVTAKTYGLMSARRSGTMMREATSKGQMGQAPSFASILRYLDKPELTPILVALIEKSALPLIGVETHFSPDSSGFGTDVHDEWFEEKHGKPTERRKRAKYIKAHIMCGADTKIVTAVKVTVENSADSPQLSELLNATVKNFKPEAVSGDRAYLSHDNLREIYNTGAMPLIPFKKDSVPHDPKRKKDPLWTTLYHFFHLHREEFLEHYHRRSNVETAFSMIKRKFNGYVRTKNPTAQVNEVLTKILCNNIYVLILAMVERDIKPNWTPAVEQLGLLDDAGHTGQQEEAGVMVE